MKILPSIQSSITQEHTLDLNTSLITHSDFAALLAYIKADYITFKEVSVTETPEKNILIKGISSFQNNVLQKSEFIIIPTKEDESSYNFEWFGFLDTIDLKDLYQTNIIQKHPLNIIANLTNTTFQDVQLFFTQKTESFLLYAADSDCNINLPSIGLSIYEIGFHYEAYFINPEEHIYTISGVIELGNTALLVEIEVPNKNTCWSLELKYPVLLNNIFQDLSTFFSQQPLLKPILGDGKFANHLPADLQHNVSVYLNEFKVLFNPVQPSMYSISTSIDLLTHWEPIQGFQLQNIGLSTFITFHGNSVGCTLKIFGQFSFIENWFVGFSFVLPLNKQDDWVIHLDGYADLDQLSKLESLNLFKLDALNLPPEWLVVKDIRLHNLEIVFNPYKKKVKRVEVQVHLKAESTIIPGVTIKDPELEFSIDFEND